MSQKFITSTEIGKRYQISSRAVNKHLADKILRIIFPSPTKAVVTHPIINGIPAGSAIGAMGVPICSMLSGVSAHTGVANDNASSSKK
jgi:hypothetical protein